MCNPGNPPLPRESAMAPKAMPRAKALAQGKGKGKAKAKAKAKAKPNRSGRHKSAAQGRVRSGESARLGK